MSFSLTKKQEAAQALLAGPQKHTMLEGGSRSGKTFLFVRAIVVRSLAAPGSRHAALRFRYNHVVQSLGMDTMPKVMRLCFPGVTAKWDRQMGLFRFPNESELWLGGLDDKERTEKVLGQEYSTILLNECSQIPWSSVGIMTTRLAQAVQIKVDGIEPRLLSRRMYYDANPPSKAHWTYKVFHQAKDPETGLFLNDPTAYAHMRINPHDNLANLPPDYLKTLEGLPARLQKRFLLGEYADATPNALFADETIDKWRALTGELPDMQRIAIGVDPSGSGDTDNADNDAIGIVVVGLGVDGNAYVLEDCTIKAGPAVWGNVATTAFDRHGADVIVGETNYGGAMVAQVIQTARARTPFRAVTASRGKVVRAEPFSGLYETGKIRHVGYHQKLEDELSAFSTLGYTGHGSPNRADALIWALAELFPGLVRPPKKAEKKTPEPMPSPHGWLA